MEWSLQKVICSSWALSWHLWLTFRNFVRRKVFKIEWFSIAATRPFNLWKLHKWFQTICLLNSLTFMNEFLQIFFNGLSLENAKKYEDAPCTLWLMMSISRTSRPWTSQQCICIWHNNLHNVKQSHKFCNWFVFQDSVHATKSPDYLLSCL